MNRTISKTVDLSRFQSVDQLTSPLYQLEVDGHTFEITVLQNKEPVTVTGSVAARFIRPDGTTVSFNGTKSGNVVSITLPQACYLYNGRFGMVVFVSGSGTTMALYACAGSVYKSTTDAIIDPDGNIPTLEELLAEIEACEDATAAANAAATNANGAVGYIAGVYNPSSSYAVNDYCINNGKLYKCITAIGAGGEAWISSHWFEVTAGSELTHSFRRCEPPANNTSLNDLYENGWYVLPAANVYTDTPEANDVTGQRIVTIMTSVSSSYPTSNTYRIMTYFNHQTGVSATRFYFSGSWKSWITQFAYKGTVANNGDLNDLTEQGWYVVDSASTIANAPEAADKTGNRFVMVYTGQKGQGSATTLRMMTYYNADTGVTATRIYYNNAWLGWSLDFGYRGTLAANTDLNELKDQGWYVLAANSEYSNCPEGDTVTGQRVVIVLPVANPASSSSYRLMIYFNNETGIQSTRFFFSGSWHSWSVSFRFNGGLADGTDLNDLYEQGWYTLGAGYTYPNCPEGDDITGQRIIMIFTNRNNPAASNTYRVMLYYNNVTGISTFRWYYTNSWHRWIRGGFSALPSATDTIDLNAGTEMGWRYIGYSITCQNSPEPENTVGQRFIFVYPAKNSGESSMIRMMHYANLYSGLVAMRVYVSGKWEAWTILSHADANTMLDKITPVAQAGQGENTGDNLRIVSYNVARYNNNTSTYLSDEKLFNFRKAIGKFNADILCIQEDMQYIDSNGTKGSQSYLYLPQYPYNYNGGKWRNVVHSKKPATAHGRVKLTAQGNDYRSIEFALYTIGAKTLLVCSSHPSWNDSGEGGESAAQIAIRLSNYTEIFQFVNREISLPDLTSGSAVTAPEHTHCIICMDGNSVTATDKTNLETIAAQNDFILGNGGALGWFYTCQSTTPVLSSLDNIIVSDNIIINNIESYMELWRNLYSDHVPVVADVTLL